MGVASSQERRGTGSGSPELKPSAPGAVTDPVVLQVELDDSSAPRRSAGSAGGLQALHHSSTGRKIEAIADYKIGKTLGQGEYGKVKLARNENTGHCVAVKVIDRSKVAVRPAGSKQLAQEINAMKILRHPNVVRLFEVITTPAKIFMVIEYAEGGDLLSYLNMHPHLLPEARAQELFRGITAGLHFCHMLGVYHRDLKLENILLHHHEVKIADFGMARITKPSGFCETLCGSPDYAAPEILRESTAYDGQLADVWSCGVILFALLCRYLPFQAAHGDIPALFASIKAGDFTLPTHVSEQPAQVVRAMLTVNTSERVTIKQIRQHPWVCGAEPLRQPIKMSASHDFTLVTRALSGEALAPSAAPVLPGSSGPIEAAAVAEVSRPLQTSRSHPCVPDVAAMLEEDSTPDVYPAFVPARTGGCPPACPWVAPLKTPLV